MVAQIQTGSTYVSASMGYATTDIADSNGTMIAIQATTNEYTATADGSIIGFAARLNGTLTTGTLTFAPTINGTVSSNTFGAQTGTLNAQNAYQKVPFGLMPFKAGDAIGLMWTKAGTVTPTTRDGDAQLLLIYSGYDY